MKYFIAPLISLLLAQACSTKPTAGEAQKVAPTEVVPKGLELIQGNDCQTCHHNTNKLVGPAYTTIANKYESTEENTTLLISKVINGGSGVWGDMPMNAHPTLSEEDAREIVQYILSLDTAQ